MSLRQRAPYSHQISLDDLSSASAWSIASTGVAPIPALIRTTGSSPERRVKLPRAALAYSRSPTCILSSILRTGQAVGFALDADAIAFGAGLVRQRIAAQQR